MIFCFERVGYCDKASEENPIQRPAAIGLRLEVLQFHIELAPRPEQLAIAYALTELFNPNVLKSINCESLMNVHHNLARMRLRLVNDQSEQQIESETY
jgi:hypothetical protein